MTVLTVITREEGTVAVARLGRRVARALDEYLVVLCLESGDKEADVPASVVPGGEIPEGAGAAVATVCFALERGRRSEELRAEDDGVDGGTSRRPLPEPEVEVRRRATRRRLTAVLETVRELDASVLIAAKHSPRSRKVPLARKLFTAAPCHTLLVRPGEDSGTEERSGGHILVPTAGGPHAAIALRLGERLAGAEGGRVVPLYVASEAGELAGEVHAAGPVAEQLEATPGARLLAVTSGRESGERVLEIELAAPGPLPAELPSEAAEVAREAPGDDLGVRVGTRLQVEVR